MNIDLLMTADGDTGLVSDTGFESPVAGVLFDAETTLLTIELSSLETLHLNIPVEDRLGKCLLHAMRMHVGVLGNGRIEDSRQVPLMLINDPENPGGFESPVRPSRSVAAFEHFMRRCVTGQPVHRDDLGDELTAEGVATGLNRAVLQFAPHLARARAMEAAPTIAPRAPGFGPGGTSPVRYRSTGRPGPGNDDGESSN